MKYELNVILTAFPFLWAGWASPRIAHLVNKEVETEGAQGGLLAAMAAGQLLVFSWVLALLVVGGFTWVAIYNGAAGLGVIIGLAGGAFAAVHRYKIEK